MTKEDTLREEGKDVCGGNLGSIQVNSGLEFFPLNPLTGDIHILDIAHALSMQVRFSGHTMEPYTVAEHSVRVSYLVPPEHALWALLHDASEAYLVDLPRPIKHQPEMQPYRNAEKRLMSAVCQRFGLPETEPPCVKRADRLMLYLEMRDLFPRVPHWIRLPKLPPDLHLPIPVWGHVNAKAIFLRRYYELCGHDHALDEHVLKFLGLANFQTFDWSAHEAQIGQ